MISDWLKIGFKSFFGMILMFSSFTGFGHELRGKIYDSSQNPVAGVGVYNETTEAFTYSGINGYFEFDSISVNDVLYFYSLGFRTTSRKIAAEDLDSSVAIVLEEAPVSLEQIVLISKLDAFSRMVRIDTEQNPVRSSQEVLRRVPGLLIGQHAGGGKAEQLFLRGFDLDHGTDISISVDDMPVNMVSHAHGQGYADLHFLIPETLDKLDFEKGPYKAEYGNFATAGNVAIKTKKKIDRNKITLEAGDFNTLRMVGLMKILETANTQAYVASEGVLTDGYFTSPQNFNRLNLMGNFLFSKEGESLRLAASHFQSRWDASGQIPQRAVDQGIIGRFGSIDDTEGGMTSRTNLWMNHYKSIDDHQSVKTSAYVTAYDFELYSNFTFFLEDPVNGDQIRQKEDRLILGAKSVYSKKIHTADEDSHAELDLGTGFRYDKVSDVELSRTRNRRETLDNLALGQIDEFNGFAFANLEYRLGKWTFNPALRADYFSFQYENELTETYDLQRKTKLFLAPKLNILHAFSPDFQAYAKTGFGFHSNDTRVVIAN
ncbi:MAG: TonB-dependent receptor plug domain-containing protein, partial [Flavobacteriaceae bacterium]|nr:TonB-dependent receptor [Muriicola sp.]NNL39846.1 TonB-dependent receptor plug domain-containing protein [Flavobacteriaceae bacterium]